MRENEDLWPPSRDRETLERPVTHYVFTGASSVIILCAAMYLHFPVYMKTRLYVALRSHVDAYSYLSALEEFLLSVSTRACSYKDVEVLRCASVSRKQIRVSILRNQMRKG